MGVALSTCANELHAASVINVPFAFDGQLVTSGDSKICCVDAYEQIKQQESEL